MFENIRLSFQGIFGHKMRSFLTMLGIIIGIAAIIAIVSTIKGTNDQIKNNLVGAGDNLVDVKLSMGGYDITPYDGMNLDNIPVIDGNMLETMKDMKDVAKVCIYHENEMYEGISYRDRSAEGLRIIGTDNSYLDINNYLITAGRKFVQDDFNKRRNVCIIDRNAADSLFEGEEPVNQTIEIKGIPFIVAGVIDKSDDFEPVINSPEEWYTYYGESNSGFIVIPETAWPELFSYDQPFQVIVKATSTEAMSSAGKEVEEYLNPL